MKKLITKEVSFCDKCKKEDSYLVRCLSCGTEMCYECKNKHGKSYRHGVYACGSGDGFYCNACDALLISSGKDRRHNAYLAIKMLLEELNLWSEDFKKRQEAAEKAVKAFSQ